MQQTRNVLSNCSVCCLVLLSQVSPEQPNRDKSAYLDAQSFSFFQSCDNLQSTRVEYDMSFSFVCFSGILSPMSVDWSKNIP